MTSDADVLRLHECFNEDDLHQRLRELLAARRLPAKFTVLTMEDDAPPRVVFSTAGARGLVRGDHRWSPLIASGLGYPVFPARTSPFNGELDELAVHGGMTLAYAGKPFGYLLVHQPPEDRASAARDLGAVGAHYARAFAQVQLYQSTQAQLAAREEQIEALGVARDILSRFDLDDVLARVMGGVMTLAGAEVGALVLADGDSLRMGVEWAFDLDAVRALKTAHGHGFVSRCMEMGAPVWVDRVDDPRYGLDASPVRGRVRSLAVLPLSAGERPLGAVVVINPGGDDAPDAPDARGEDRLAALEMVAGLASIAIENSRFHAAALERERLDEELRVARRIQETLLPRCAPAIPGYDIALWSEPCRDVGGDFHDFIELPNGALGIAVGDVSGHGVGAAMLMTGARAALRALISAGRSPQQALPLLNELGLRDTEARQFYTLWFGVLEPGSGRLTFVNAGHDAPVLFRAAGGTAPLEAGGVPLAMFPGSRYPPGRTVVLEPGDALCVCTDGVWEQPGDAGKPLGRARLAQVVREAMSGTAADVVRAVRDAVQRHQQSRRQRDDRTLMVIRREESP